MVYYHDAKKSDAVESSKGNFPCIYRLWKTYSCLVISSSTAERANKFVQSYVDGLSMDLDKTSVVDNETGHHDLVSKLTSMHENTDIRSLLSNTEVKKIILSRHRILPEKQIHPSRDLNLKRIHPKFLHNIEDAEKFKTFLKQ